MATLGKNALERDIYSATSEFLKQKVNGGVFFSGCRPHDSNLEDAVIVVSTSTAEQIQEGRAKINIFVADIDIKGQKVPNIARLRELEQLDVTIIDKLNNGTSDYLYWLSDMTNTFAEPVTREHFININIGFKHKTF